MLHCISLPEIDAATGIELLIGDVEDDPDGAFVKTFARQRRRSVWASVDYGVFFGIKGGF
jgi:hypothetical protein